MPTKAYHAHVADLPKDVRRNGTYERVGVVSDHAIWSFIWVDGFEWPEGYHHQHEHDQMMYIISGAIRMQVGDEEYDLAAGDVLYIPGGVPHSGEPIGGEPAHLLEAFSPIRTDYLYIASHQLDELAGAFGETLSSAQGRVGNSGAESA